MSRNTVLNAPDSKQVLSIVSLMLDGYIDLILDINCMAVDSYITVNVSSTNLLNNIHSLIISIFSFSYCNNIRLARSPELQAPIANPFICFAIVSLYLVYDVDCIKFTHCFTNIISSFSNTFKIFDQYTIVSVACVFVQDGYKLTKSKDIGIIGSFDLIDSICLTISAEFSATIDVLLFVLDLIYSFAPANNFLQHLDNNFCNGKKMSSLLYLMTGRQPISGLCILMIGIACGSDEFSNAFNNISAASYIFKNFVLLRQCVQCSKNSSSLFLQCSNISFSVTLCKTLKVFGSFNNCNAALSNSSCDINTGPSFLSAGTILYFS